VAGIPVLKKGVIGTTGQLDWEVTNLIGAGRHREALLAVLLPPPPDSAALAPDAVRALRRWREQAEALLTGPGNQMTVCDLFDFYFHHSGVKVWDHYNYFVFRFGQPRHLTALSLASLIERPKKPILDLACGFGHVTRHLLLRAKEQPVIGLDRNFLMMYVAKNWLAPAAKYVCAEADIGLPFSDGSFSAAVCSDAFHWFAGKANSMRELIRVTRGDGTIILATLRNVFVQGHEYPGTLLPEGYEALVVDMLHRLVANSDILSQYLEKQGPSLARPAEVGHLAGDPWLSVVASHRQELFRDYGPFEDWPHAHGCLRLNPLYREERHDEPENVHLRRVFPSAHYEQENAEYRYKRYLPETVSVKPTVLVDLAQGKRTPEVEGLIEQCVVVGMPERYIRVDFPRTHADIDGTAENVDEAFYIEKIEKKRVSDVIAELILPGDAFILVDQAQLGSVVPAGRCAIPFLERGGQYWGPPSDDDTAIRELERLRQSGASFIVFTLSARWWLHYYFGLRDHLRTKYCCILENDRLMVFDLRS
jgi:SAM-dependent methyltransferase